MRRGELRWYTFAAPDKRRPVLLLTRDEVDMYWVVQSPEWSDLQHDPKLSVGSLKDDWEALQRVLEGQMPTAVDFDRLAAVLRAVSERMAR